MAILGLREVGLREASASKKVHWSNPRQEHTEMCFPFPLTLSWSEFFKCALEFRNQCCPIFGWKQMETGWVASFWVRPFCLLHLVLRALLLWPVLTLSPTFYPFLLPQPQLTLIPRIRLSNTAEAAKLKKRRSLYLCWINLFWNGLRSKWATA